MLKMPERLTPESFLERHWQKKPLFMPAALGRVTPSISRNELGWLATLDDVESRLVFVDRSGAKTQYRTETGPFDVEYLQQLPKRDWTLLIHDVEKHLPAMRALFHQVPFIPDWRFDDLMVSFAAPGGGVGPHRDNYDVFLCQGTGIRNWRFTTDAVADDPEASSDLALLCEFASKEDYNCANGDVLYLPPDVAHWGTAKRACITYSIGMRAPQAADVAYSLNSTVSDAEAFYRDPDLTADEAQPGRISQRSTQRAINTLALPRDRQHDVASALGRFATEPKDWLRPDSPTPEETALLFDHVQEGGQLHFHGMSHIAFDDRNAYVNGNITPLPAGASSLLARVCAQRTLSKPVLETIELAEMLVWMIQQGLFEVPENF